MTMQNTGNTGKKTSAPKGVRTPRKAKRRSSKRYRAVNSAATAPALKLVPTPRGGSILGLRSQLGLNRETFARLLPVSTRSLASIEHGQRPSETVTRRLTEIGRVVDALREVVDDEAVGPWMLRPNQAFDGLKPIEVIERGEVDRIWQMTFLLRSGTPS